MDLPEPPSPFFYIVHRSQHVFQTTSRIGTELLLIGSNCLSDVCLSMSRDPQKYIAFAFVLTSPAVFRMPGSSNLDGFRDELYRYRFMWCCLHDLFNTARIILVSFPLSLFFMFQYNNKVSWWKNIYRSLQGKWSYFTCCSEQYFTWSAIECSVGTVFLFGFRNRNYPTT